MTNSSSSKLEGQFAVSFPRHPLVYVRYKDHVLFKNIRQPQADAVERETVGWLSKQTDEIMLIEHDRTVPNAQIPSGKGNGVIILKSCITEIRRLPPKDALEWHLNCPAGITKSEYAFRSSERKTHGAKDSERKQKHDGKSDNCSPRHNPNPSTFHRRTRKP